MKLVMESNDSLCGNLQKCVNTMETLFWEQQIGKDPTYNYITLAWCGKEADTQDDGQGNVWWYDGGKFDRYFIQKSSLLPKRIVQGRV